MRRPIKILLVLPLLALALTLAVMWASPGIDLPDPPDFAREFMGEYVGEYDGDYALEVDPIDGLTDEPLAIRLSGGTPGEIVTLELHAVDAAELAWHSSATFTVDEHGRIDPALQAPIAGGYRGVDPRGLLWSTRVGEERVGLTTTGLEYLELKITARAADRVLAQATVRRRYPWVPGRLHRQELDEDGLVGIYWHDGRDEPHPTVLLLGGSGGRKQVMRAALLAERGYAVLDLLYFGQEGLPEQLVEVPLEYFDRALDWLERQPTVDPERIGIWGGSKGAEAALLVASTNPRLDAVVAVVPSSVAWQGVSWKIGGIPGSSWSRGGEPLDYARVGLSFSFLGDMIFGRPIHLRPGYLQGLADPARTEAAAIPVEQIDGAVLLISGGDDQLWPSSVMADQVIRRLESHAFPHVYRHLEFEQAGHSIGIPGFPRYWPRSPRIFQGGTPAADEEASAASWSATLDFFADFLGP